MIVRVESFVATLVLAGLCNCATTKPDPIGTASSLIGLPEQSNPNDENPKIDENEVSRDQSPEIVPVFSELGENMAEDSSLSSQSAGYDEKSLPTASNLSSNPDAIEIVSRNDSKSEILYPSEAKKGFLESENRSNIDEPAPASDHLHLGSFHEANDSPSSDIFHNDSSSNSGATEPDPVEVNPYGVRNPITQMTLDHTDLEPSVSSGDSENKNTSANRTPGFSVDESSPLDESENTGYGLDYETERQLETPSSKSTSNLGFSQSTSDTLVRLDVDSTTLFPSEPHAEVSNLSTDESRSMDLGPLKSDSEAGPTKSSSRYVALSQWLSRTSSETEDRDEVYLGHSEPNAPIKVEHYLDESPLVGIEQPVPWEYDSIANLLRPRDGAAFDGSDEIDFDYASVRKFFARQNFTGTTGTTDSVGNAMPTAFRYDGVLHWLDKRGSVLTPREAKPPVVRKYSNALNWIRNEGR